MAEENETLDDEHEDDEGNDEEEDDAKGRKKPKEVIMSQRRFTSVMTREKDEGRRAGRREILKQLDVEDVDELEEIVKAHREQEDKNTSDAAKAQREADKAKRDAESAREEIKKDKHDIKVERALLAAEVPAKKAAKVARLVDVEVGADEDEIADAIEDLKQEFPHLFKADESDETDDDESDGNTSRSQGPPRSDPGKQPRKKTKPGNTRDQAQSLLHERHPQLANKS